MIYTYIYIFNDRNFILIIHSKIIFVSYHSTVSSSTSHRKMDFELLYKTICNFLQTYKQELLDEHYQEFLNCIGMLKQFENSLYIESVNGFHYSNCCWSSNDCKLGPDTCACFIIEKRLLRIKKLMLLYKRLK